MSFNRSHFPLKPGEVATLISGNLWSVFPEQGRGASYDRLAPLYDWVVGNSLYNRIIWGNWASDYWQQASDAVANFGDGPILDCGCGSLIFTADAYRSGPLERMTLFDQSLGMMQRAARLRLGGAVYLQGDALDLPFADESFSDIMAWGLLHIFGSQSRLLGELRRVAKPGARVTLTTLTLSERAIGNRMLRALNRRGEVADPEQADVVRRAFAQHFAVEADVLKGNMLFLRGRPAT